MKAVSHFPIHIGPAAQFAIGAAAKFVAQEMEWFGGVGQSGSIPPLNL